MSYPSSTTPSQSLSLPSQTSAAPRTVPLSGPRRYLPEGRPRHANAPVKQAVIAPSALSLLYPPAGLEGYSREEFLGDLLNEAETDIRSTLEAGAHVAQLDFTEGRLSLKLDPKRRHP